VEVQSGSLSFKLEGKSMGKKVEKGEMSMLGTIHSCSYLFHPTMVLNSGISALYELG
jgi:hypothetical protein